MAGAMGVPADCLQFSANLARGLTYYTGIVFETFIQGHERYGSVASGGRYDNLVEDFKPGLKLQGVGGSIGLTRLFDVLKALKVVDLTRQTTAQVYVCSRESSLVTTAVKVATALREKGIFTELSFAPQKIKAELGIAANKGIPYVVMVMQRKEIVVRRVFVRDNESEDNRNAEIEQESYESIEEVANRVAALTATQPMRREEAKE
jgi:histidyl-tRNA synthetase